MFNDKEEWMEGRADGDYDGGYGRDWMKGLIGFESECFMVGETVWTGELTLVEMGSKEKDGLKALLG